MPNYMPTKNKIQVPAEKAGFRLDIFLSEELGVNRSQVQKMIENEKVLVNEKLPKKAGDKLGEGATIVIARSKAMEQSQKITGLPRSLRSLAMTPKIIAETPDYIVIEKPTGMLTHPTMANETNTLTNFLLEKYPKIKNIGEDPARPGIVHRLDKEASGLIVVAKTQKMFNHLKEQFKNRTIEKEYFALVHGKVARDCGEITFPIARSKDRMAAVPESQEKDGAKEAKTEFTIEKQFVNFTLLKIKILTGRMHQIRVHMLAYNHPLVGDPLYFQKKQKKTWDKKLGRLFLHSAKLGFVDLEGKKQTFESPMQKELEEFLKLLK
ncbi:MAG: RluA family pseudouridine synthase [Patescibacteria group bacterium]